MYTFFEIDIKYHHKLIFNRLMLILINYYLEIL